MKTSFNPFFSGGTADQFNKYCDLYDTDHFSAEKFEIREALVAELTKKTQNLWIKKVEYLYMTNSRQSAWRLLKKLSGDFTIAIAHVNLSADQITT